MVDDGKEKGPALRRRTSPFEMTRAAARPGSRWVLHDALERLALGDLQRTTQVVAYLRARVDAEALVHRGEEVAELIDRILLDVGAVVGGRAVDLTPLDGAAAEDDRPAARPVIA